VAVSTREPSDNHEASLTIHQDEKRKVRTGLCRFYEEREALPGVFREAKCDLMASLMTSRQVSRALKGRLRCRNDPRYFWCALLTPFTALYKANVPIDILGRPVLKQSPLSKLSRASYS
jgi:hypothetical protein